MNFWNTWARYHRNARALAAAAAMLVAILAMASLRCNPMTHREQVLGLVVAIEAEVLKDVATCELRTRVLAATPDSTEIRLLLPPPIPRLGDFIPLAAEYYRKGNIEYYLEIQKWRTGGAL